MLNFVLCDDNLNIVKKLKEMLEILFFKNDIDAFNAYKTEKEKCIKLYADKYKNELNKSVYNALYNYKVEIND